MSRPVYPGKVVRYFNLYVRFFFCFFQKVCLRGNRDPNLISVVLFSQNFPCHGKFVVSFIQRLLPPLFAVSDKRHEITQKYFFTEWIFHETEFFGREGSNFRYVICVNSTFSMFKYFYFFKNITRLLFIKILSWYSTPLLSVGNFEKKIGEKALFI